MLRIFIGLVFLASCSMKAVKTGGEGVYTYDNGRDYSVDELKSIAPQVVETSRRDPPVGKLEVLFGKGQSPLKRFGILVFETQIQPTRGGLANEDRIFLSEQGKQLLTERMLKVWEESFTTLAPDLDYLTSARLKRAKSFHQFGLPENDYVRAKRTSLAPDDIFFLPKGAKTATTTTLNPRGMRDMSLAFVPAAELMGGPKWSEQHKQFVNEVMKELKLDAVVIVMSEVSWTAARFDKHSGEPVPEEIKLRIAASTLTSLSDYRERAGKLGHNDVPVINVCFRVYEGKIRFPTRISVPESEQSFELIEKEILNPMLKAYKDLSIMTVDQLTGDLRKTF